MSILAPTGRYPTFKFDKPGAKIRGTVTQPPKDMQSRVFGTTELAFWPDGSPKLQAQIVLQDDDGNEWAVYARDRMAKAIRDAVGDAHADDVEPGGILEVEFTEYGTGKSAMPPKLYAAKYTPPSVSSEADDNNPPF